MNTINRTAITVKGKKPFIEWANSFDDGGPQMDINDIYTTTYLIPETYDEYNYEIFLKKNYKTIFESELDSWMTDPAVWPQKRTYKLFKEWFDIQVSDMIFDLAKDELTIEE